MDDYSITSITESKNEWCARLLNVLTPCLIEGIKSVFEEAYNMCIENDEEDKYLMTFQNLLNNIPKWSMQIVDSEKDRIVGSSGCNYLEDLLTCVHITQLKSLTVARAGLKQKKVDIDIPNISIFLHKAYINIARKVYVNVYLFEKDILPLTVQKNMREAEIMCQECILQVIRDNMPVESILRAYMDETVDEEIIEETIEKIPTVEELQKIEEDKKQEEINIVKTENTLNVEKPGLEKVEKVEKVENTENTTNTLQENTNVSTENNNSPPIKLEINTDELLKEDDDDVSNLLKQNDTKKVETPKSSLLKFNNNDSVLDMGTNKEEIINAPKTIERLEEISKTQNEKRKAEEAEEDDDDDDSIKIFSDTPLALDKLDIHDLNKELNINPPTLEGVEILS